jgi:cytochrome c oxidase subunit 2
MLNLIAQVNWLDWLPEKASTFAADLDWLFYFELWLSLFVFVGIGGCLFYFVWKYRRKSHDDHPHGSHHNNTIEIVWSVIPLIIVMLIFVWGFRGMMDMVTPPVYSTEIVVTASRWNWQFQYPNGAVSSMEDGLIVPVNKPIRIVLKAPLDDVLHSFYVPAFRVKKDVVPGRYNETWFQATMIGEFPLYCAEYCGQNHSQMRSKVTVMSEEEYVEKLIEWANFLDNDPPAVAGKKVFAIKGCSSCHSVEGKGGTGPALNDLFGRDETFTNGSSQKVDENYIQDSINNPSALIVAGFSDQMSPPDVNEKELNVLIAYIKSISKHYAGNRDALFEKPQKDDATEEDQ